MNIIKTGLIFTAGSAAGAGVMYFVMSKKLKAERELKQVEIDQVKAAYSKSEKNQEMKKEYAIKMDFPKEVEEDSDEVENTYDEALKTVKEMKEMVDEPIRICTAEEFDGNEEDTPMFLTYYKLDDLVVYSDTMIPMEHPEAYLGDSFKDAFDDSDVIYIKNDIEGALYELMIDEVSSLDYEEEDETEEDKEPSFAEGGD